MKDKKTKYGKFHQDKSGLWHYLCLHGKANHVFEALEDAIKFRPGAAWFWFNETPAPILPDDTVKTLLRRWENWRKVYQNDRGLWLMAGRGEFLKLLLDFSEYYK